MTRAVLKAGTGARSEYIGALWFTMVPIDGYERVTGAARAAYLLDGGAVDATVVPVGGGAV